MATLEALFLRTPSEAPEALLERLARLARHSPQLRALRHAAWDPSKQWVRFSVAASEVPALAQLASGSLETTTIGVALQTVVDAFGFWLFARGTEQRALVYGFYGDEERVWNEARGLVQPWEVEPLFRASADIESLVERHQYEDPDLVRRVYRDRQIAIGTHLPEVGFNARKLVEAVFEHYDIPSTCAHERRVGPPWPLSLLGPMWGVA